MFVLHCVFAVVMHFFLEHVLFAASVLADCVAFLVWAVYIIPLLKLAFVPCVPRRVQIHLLRGDFLYWWAGTFWHLRPNCVIALGLGRIEAARSAARSF